MTNELMGKIVNEIAEPAQVTAEQDASAPVVPLFELNGLAVDIRTRQGPLRVVSDVSLKVQRGETVGLVGESGSGKTMTSLAVMAALPSVASISAGSIRLEGQELVGLPKRTFQEIKGNRIAMIFQDAKRSLNPSFTVGNQIAEVARRHLGLSRRDSWERAVEMLDRVGIQRPAERAGDYPFAFSGGMAQRVMIAMSLVCDPHLLIADEPSTALDVTVQAQVLALLRRLRDEMGLGVLLITHDLGVVAQACDRVAVMYGGQVVESAGVHALFNTPRHPYTAGLIDSMPQVHHRSEAMSFIPGVVPSPRTWPTGCRFHPRCAAAESGRCDVGDPDLVDYGKGHLTRCVRMAELNLVGVKRA